jgi:hypothetical protein
MNQDDLIVTKHREMLLTTEDEVNIVMNELDKQLKISEYKNRNSINERVDETPIALRGTAWRFGFNK